MADKFVEGEKFSVDAVEHVLLLHTVDENKSRKHLQVKRTALDNKHKKHLLACEIDIRQGAIQRSL